MQFYKYRCGPLFSFLIMISGCLLWSVAHATDEPLASVDGVAITSEEVGKDITGELSKLEEQIYDLKRRKLDALIDEKLLTKEAAKRGVSMPALLDAEVTSKTGLITEEEVEKFYQANKGKIQVEESEAREKIRASLQSRKLAQQRQEFLSALRAQANIVVHLKPPPVTRIEIGGAAVASKGSANAPVTIVEFTDFHCPFCKRALATLSQIESRYADKIKIVFRDFPIDQLHPAARKAHEAARCANAQGTFWAYHDKLFATAPQASVENLKTYAKELRLDSNAFDQCLATDKYRSAVQKDIDEGKRAGVTGTPAFFINGRMISGAQPLDAFARIIDDELARRMEK